MDVEVQGPGRKANNVPESWVIVYYRATDLRGERKSREEEISKANTKRNHNPLNWPRLISRRLAWRYWFDHHRVSQVLLRFVYPSWFWNAVRRYWHVLCVPVLRLQDMILCKSLWWCLAVMFWVLACRTITLARPFDIKLYLKYSNFDVCFWFISRDENKEMMWLMFWKPTAVRGGMCPPRTKS